MLAIEPVTLSTDRLILRPMRREDAAAYGAAASDGALWEKTTTSVPRPEDAATFIDKALAAQAAGTQLPFTTVLRDGDRVVGSSRYLNIDAANRRLEIGHTWIARSYQRSFVNTHAKLLMLGHAFETLGCIAVELRTHRLNEQSRTAILRLGAKLDGILRSHSIMPDGHIRDTAVYSILASEWPDVKAALQARLDGPAGVARS